MNPLKKTSVQKGYTFQLLPQLHVTLKQHEKEHYQLFGPKGNVQYPYPIVLLSADPVWEKIYLQWLLPNKHSNEVKVLMGSDSTELNLEFLKNLQQDLRQSHENLFSWCLNEEQNDQSSSDFTQTHIQSLKLLVLEAEKISPSFWKEIYQFDPYFFEKNFSQVIFSSCNWDISKKKFSASWSQGIACSYWIFESAKFWQVQEEIQILFKIFQLPLEKLKHIQTGVQKFYGQNLLRVFDFVKILSLQLKESSESQVKFFRTLSQNPQTHEWTMSHIEIAQFFNPQFSVFSILSFYEPQQLTKFYKEVLYFFKEAEEGMAFDKSPLSKRWLGVFIFLQNYLIKMRTLTQESTAQNQYERELKRKKPLWEKDHWKIWQMEMDFLLEVENDLKLGIYDHTKSLSLKIWTEKILSSNL